MSNTHDENVAARFAPAAAAYVASPVHAAGQDLEDMKTLLARLRPRRALDLGAGGGHVSYAMAALAERATACDPLPEMLAAVEAEAARRGIRNLDTACGAAEALPFADGEFDFLACRYSAHHWRDWQAGLRQARRVLQRGATALFIDVVSAGGPLNDTHLQAAELLRDPSHVRDYTVAEWQAALAEAHFAPKLSRCWRIRIDFAAWTARIMTGEDNVRALRLVQAAAPAETRAFFAMAEDGSFSHDVASFEAVAC